MKPELVKATIVTRIFWATHDFQQQKQLEEAIRDLERFAVERAHREGYLQGYEDGKRRAVN